MTELNRKKLAKVHPYELLKKLGLNEPPFDPHEIAKRLGIEIDKTLSVENIEFSGSITNKNNMPQIWVNPLDGDLRQRFTLAHELGHYINDMLSNGKTEIKDTPETLHRGGTSDIREINANNFAGMLLMPKDAIISKANALVDEHPSKSIPAKDFVIEMAKIFHVSKPAMLVRLKKLGIISKSIQV